MINSKNKKYEIRTYDFKKLSYPATVFINVTKKTKHIFNGKIAAAFIMYGPADIVEFKMLDDFNLNEKTGQLVEDSGLSINELKKLLKGKNPRFIKVNEFKPLFNPVDITTIGLKAPQGITYLTIEQVKRIRELERLPF
jgi:hypothetical protein